MINSYKELPVGKYLEICKVLGDKSLSGLDQQVRILSLLNSLSEEEILRVPIVSYKRMVIESEFIGTECKAGKMKRLYRCGGFRLMPVRNLSKEITVKQQADLSSFSRDPEKYLVNILACFLIPRGNRYEDGYDLESVCQAIREDLSVYDALTIFVHYIQQGVTELKEILNIERKHVASLPDSKQKEVLRAKIREQEMIFEKL